MVTYTVLVDFHCEILHRTALRPAFEESDGLEQIGHNQYQAGFGVEAPNEDEAYRRAVNLVEAKLDVLGVTDGSTLGAEVYPPDESE